MSIVNSIFIKIYKMMTIFICSITRLNIHAFEVSTNKVKTKSNYVDENVYIIFQIITLLKYFIF